MNEPRLVLSPADGRAHGTLEAHDGTGVLWSLAVAVTRTRDVERTRARARALLQQPIDGVADVVHFLVEGDELVVASRRLVGHRPLTHASADAATRLVQVAEILDRAAVLPELARAHGAIDASSVRLTPSGRLVIERWAEGPGGEPAEDRRALLCIARSLGLVDGDDNVELDATCVALVKRALARGPSRAVVKPASVGLFDAALGAALADDDATRAATAAVPALADTPPAPVPVLPTTPTVFAKKPVEVAKEVPRRSSRVLVIVAGVVLVAAAAWFALRPEPPATVSLVPPIAPPQRAQSDFPATAPMPVDAAPPPIAVAAQKRVRVVPPAGLAHLSIRSDSDAAIYVDGAYRANAPAELALSPGRHALRLEAAEGAMHLLPHEERVELVAGEHRLVTIDLR